MAVDYTHADAVLASLNDTPPATIRALARALALAGGPLSYLGMAFDSWADHREDPALTGILARLRLAHWLRTTAPDCDELLERLDGISEPPWSAIREALASVTDPPATGKKASR
jgi:hypothetical protein